MTDAARGGCAAQDPEELMAFLDGELPAERAAAVHGHVASCAACQHLRAELLGASRDLARWDAGEAPRSMTAPAAAPAPPPRVRRWTAWRPMVLAPGLAVAAIGLILTFAVPPRRSVSNAPIDFTIAPAPAASADAAVRGQEATRQGIGAGGTAAPGSAGALSLAGPPVKGPMIAREVSLRIVAGEFDRVRPAVDRILADVGGFVGQITASGARGAPRTLTGTVRVPAARLAEAIAALKTLGQVVQESQTGEDVTEQAVDLDARLTNARNTEKRLTEVLQHRTGKVGDVLEVEREIARVREEIERMDAERKNLDRRVAYATVTLEILEERKADLDLGPQSVSAQIRNAFVDGFSGAFASALAAALFAARVGPALLLWGLVLAWPLWILARRYRRATP